MLETRSLVPLWLKVAYTAFVAVLVPVYWVNYGPANFLFYCDVALLITLVALWLESPLLVSMPAVGILAMQALWVADFAGNIVGHPINGSTNYMFESWRPLFLRGLSLFHGWLPFLLIWLVWRLGYDKRAFKSWTILAWGLILVSYFFLPGPMVETGGKAVNINYVFGMSETEPQTWMPPLAWLALMLVALPALLYWPVHWMLGRWMPAADAAAEPLLAGWQRRWSGSKA